MNSILGRMATDRITGFKGVVTSSTEWLNGCVRVTLQPRHLHEGKPVESQVFDIEQIVILENEASDLEDLLFSGTGGDRPRVERAKDPK
jgi:hypothetical protein